MTHDDSRPADGIAVEEGPERTLVRMWGEVDGSLRSQASAAMAQCLGRALPVTVDVGRVTFIDSSGIAFLLQLHRAAEEAGVDVALLDPPALLLDLLEMIGMGGVIPLTWTPARPAVVDAGADGTAAARDGDVVQVLEGPGELARV